MILYLSSRHTLRTVKLNIMVLIISKHMIGRKNQTNLEDVLEKKHLYWPNLGFIREHSSKTFSEIPVKTLTTMGAP